MKRDYTKRYEYALQWKPKKSFDRLLREAMAIQQQGRPERARITPTASAPVLPNQAWLISPKARPGGVPREHPLPSELWAEPKKPPG